MGQKVHPRAFRLIITKTWDGVWFAKKGRFKELLREDVQLRDFLKKRLREALVDKIEIERSRDNVTINIYSAKPGFVIGRAGSGIEQLNKDLKTKFFAGRRVKLNVNVKEIKHSAICSRIVATQIAMDIEKRMPFRRVMKMARDKVMKGGAEGVKITLKGRLNGAEIARSESVTEGKVPLHNLRADIDFSREMARTTYGVIGVRVWINRGEVFEKTSQK